MVVVQDLQNVELLVLGLVVRPVVCAAAERVVSSSVFISVLWVRELEGFGDTVGTCW